MKNKIRFSGRSRFSLAIIAIMLSIILVTGLSLAGSYANDKDAPAKSGDQVSVYYSLSFPGGPIFESNINKTPLNFTLGSKAMISGFDRAIHGMTPGETKTVILTPDEAYGEKNESLVKTIPLNEAIDLIHSMDKENITISLIPGYSCPIIEYLLPEGKYVRYLFTNVTEDSITVDMNKPLVEKELQFTITLDSVIKRAE
ncbi:FKBP-type peptidyl-prolyl cis-trans isomerase [Methanomicrobium antiquum]|uniref:Peptidyl-prolyl cis-trans isomerase n=1 Tax=Methanomicrobium antiquum TaxID=487686 RepID=A0AAF0FL60_9EURY|nr:FKBP-type peptidyl-prolyl cis-trans isomerase [Methanomicrobium antiquum]MDD3978395.1 FKBP-type peptidyl-prolyl cis-trans isomerase [Methanomicrobium sp.]WFN36543.1 FKBP-type peptidyl-prolyl cis-trans isomerase [Methanomicrobium antiquum]